MRILDNLRSRYNSIFEPEPVQPTEIDHAVAYLNQHYKDYPEDLTAMLHFLLAPPRIKRIFDYADR